MLINSLHDLVFYVSLYCMVFGFIFMIIGLILSYGV